jgi:hypothetical protein
MLNSGLGAYELNAPVLAALGVGILKTPQVAAPLVVRPLE